MAFKKPKDGEVASKADRAALKGVGGPGILASSEVFSCGMFYLDYVSGASLDNSGIFPRAAITEVAGLPAVGKTTLILHAIAYNQHIDPDFTVLYIDFEHNLVRQQEMGTKFGIDFGRNFHYRQPKTLEGGGQFIQEAIRSPQKTLGVERIDMIVLDTLAAARPRVEISNKLGETAKPGYRGKLWAEHFRNVQADLDNDSGPAYVAINQLQQVLAMDGAFTMGGPKYDSPGSNSLKYYAANRYFLSEKSRETKKVVNPWTYEEYDEVVLQVSKVTCHKSKLGPPSREVSYAIHPGFGIDPISSMVGAGSRKPGALYIGGNQAQFGVPRGATGDKKDIVKQAMGLTNFIDLIRANPEEARALAANLNDMWVQQVETWLEMAARGAALLKKGPSLNTANAELVGENLVASQRELQEAGLVDKTPDV